MDSLIVLEKLESLRRCVARIELRRAASVAALKADPDTQDIIVLNLTRAIELYGKRDFPCQRAGEGFPFTARLPIMVVDSQSANLHPRTH